MVLRQALNYTISLLSLYVIAQLIQSEVALKQHSRLHNKLTPSSIKILEMIRIVANTSALKFQSVSLRQYIVPRARRFCTGESRSIVFQRAVQALQQPADPKNKKDVGNDIKLKLYAFYKQAETGTCVGSRPGMFDLVGRAKFDAWKELGNMSKDDAMEAYIKEVTKIFDGKLPAVTLNKSTITEAKQTFATTEKVVETTFKLRSLAEIAFPHKSQNSSNSLKLTTVNVSCDEKGIVKLFLDRPDKGNAFNMILLEELTVAWKWIKQHPQTRVVIVTSDHAHFSTGMDLSVFVHLQTVLSQESCDARKREGLIRFIDYLQQIVTEAETCGVPVISAIAGHCIGGAIDLICATDLRYCTDSTAFSVKEIDLAIVRILFLCCTILSYSLPKYLSILCMLFAV